MATDQRELGEGDGTPELAEAIATATVREEAERETLKKLRRYERAPSGVADRYDQHALPLSPSRRTVDHGVVY